MYARFVKFFTKKGVDSVIDQLEHILIKLDGIVDEIMEDRISDNDAKLTVLKAQIIDLNRENNVLFDEAVYARRIIDGIEDIIG